MRCTLYGFRIICTHIMLYWERQQFLSNENPQAAKLRLPMSTVAAGDACVCVCVVVRVHVGKMNVHFWGVEGVSGIVYSWGGHCILCIRQCMYVCWPGIMRFLSQHFSRPPSGGRPTNAHAWLCLPAVGQKEKTAGVHLVSGRRWPAGNVPKPNWF